MLTLLCLVLRQDRALCWGPSLPHHRLLGRGSSTAITRKGFSRLFLATTTGEAVKTVLSILAFFWEPSVTSKSISGFFFGFTI